VPTRTITLTVKQDAALVKFATKAGSTPEAEITRAILDPIKSFVEARRLRVRERLNDPAAWDALTPAQQDSIDALVP